MKKNEVSFRRKTVLERLLHRKKSSLPDAHHQKHPSACQIFRVGISLSSTPDIVYGQLDGNTLAKHDLLCEQEQNFSFETKLTESSMDSLSSASMELRSVLKISTQKESLQHSYSKSAREGKERKSCRFSSVTVHYHGLILGDHPGVSCGAPIALGNWMSSHETTVDAEEEVYDKQSRRHQLRLPAEVRERMLLDVGISLDTIRTMAENVKIQNDLVVLSRIVSRLKAKAFHEYFFYE